MSDDELEKLAAEMKNIHPSEHSRKQGMDAAMAAFDMEFAQEVVTETVPEKLNVSQGLANEPRPTGQTIREGRMQTLGRDAMSKLSEIFSFKPKTAMMMGSCAVALFATSLYFPNTTFEDMAAKPALEAVSVEIDEIVVTGKKAAETHPIEQEVSSEVQIVEIAPAPAPAPLTAPKTPAADKAASADDATVKAQDGINSISNLLDKVRTDSTQTEAENRDREAQFRQRRNPQAGSLAEAAQQPAKTEQDIRDIREYRAVLQQKDNIQLFVDQSDIFRQAETAEAASNQSAQPAPPVIERQQANIAGPNFPPGNPLPAPAPMIELKQAAKSTGRIASLEGAIAEFEPPKIDHQSFSIHFSDREVQPLIRIAPVMPPRAEKSGHCRMLFDVSSAGVPFNVIATNCTDSVFESASIKSVQKWKYNPKIVDGRAVARSDVENKITFRLHDERGNIIPEASSIDQFEDFESNPVTPVKETPVSTFSVDVDTASYSFLRASINRGQLPPPSAIRLEEMINYFPYNYEAPTSAEEPFKANVTVTSNPWNADTKLMHVGIKGYVPPADERPRSNIVFLIDTSGSMNAPNKLPLLINSFKLLLNTLDGDDTVSIVTYAGRAGTVLEPTAASDKHKIKSALDRLRSGGSTAGAAGLELAYNKAQESFDKEGINRVILATDGDFNVGFSSPDEMKSFVEKKRKTGIFLSVLGFGMGNYNDHLMQSLAQNGNGVAAYIDNLAEANKVLANEAGNALITIAKDVKIQVEFNPATVSEYRLIGYETRALKREDFNNDKVDAGEIGAGHSVTAIYEMTPIGSPARTIDKLRYVLDRAEQEGSEADEYAFVKIRHKLPNTDTSTLQTFPIGKGEERNLKRASDDMRFATAVAAVGQKLRGDTQLEDFSYDEVIKLASGARGEDEHGYRAEFIQLVRLMESLEE